MTATQHSYAQTLTRLEQLGLTEFNGPHLPIAKVHITIDNKERRLCPQFTSRNHNIQIGHSSPSPNMSHPLRIRLRSPTPSPIRRSSDSSMSSEDKVVIVRQRLKSKVGPRQDALSSKGSQSVRHHRAESSLDSSNSDRSQHHLHGITTGDCEGSRESSLKAETDSPVLLSGHGPDGLESGRYLRATTRRALSTETQIHMPLLHTEPVPADSTTQEICDPPSSPPSKPQHFSDRDHPPPIPTRSLRRDSKNSSGSLIISKPTVPLSASSEE